jgi:hypothetical protein
VERERCTGGSAGRRERGEGREGRREEKGEGKNGDLRNSRSWIWVLLVWKWRLSNAFWVHNGIQYWHFTAEPQKLAMNG